MVLVYFSIQRSVLYIPDFKIHLYGTLTSDIEKGEMCQLQICVVYKLFTDLKIYYNTCQRLKSVSTVRQKIYELRY